MGIINSSSIIVQITLVNSKHLEEDLMHDKCSKILAVIIRVPRNVT